MASQMSLLDTPLRLFPCCADCSKTSTLGNWFTLDGKIAEKVEILQSCGRCLITSYCSTECQRRHWRHVHRQECAATAPYNIDSLSVKINSLVQQSLFPPGTGRILLEINNDDFSASFQDCPAPSESTLKLEVTVKIKDQVVSTAHYTVLRAKWFSYYKRHLDADPNRSLKQALQLFFTDGTPPSLALDLGCGAGAETRHLVTQGWQVEAVDAEPIAKDFLSPVIPSTFQDKWTFTPSTYETFVFVPGKYMLINSSFALPYCKKEHFDRVMQQLISSLSPGGRFCGHFFDPDTTFEEYKDVQLLTAEQVKGILKDLTIEYFRSEKLSMDGKYGWLHEVVARKPPA